MIDIDNFKTIIDTYGHLEGDKVLIELAGIFKTQARSGDTIVRWGGEEFAMQTIHTSGKTRYNVMWSTGTVASYPK